MKIEPIQKLTTEENSSDMVASRNYLFIGLASLLTVTAIMHVQSGDSTPAAIVPTLIASTGFLLCWRLIPGLYILVLSFFIVAPFGNLEWRGNSSEVYGSGFRILDILLAAAVLVSLVSMIRYMSMKTTAIPSDISKSIVRKIRIKRIRPDSIVTRDEFVQLFIGIGLFTLVGQLLWITVTSLHVEALSIPPFSLHWDVFTQLEPIDPRGKYSSPLNRFLVSIGIVSFVTLTLGTIFWYWKVSRYSNIEARMTLLDTGWYENRRELNRQTKWIAWADPRNVAIAQSQPPQKRVRRFGIVFIIVTSILIGLLLYMLAILYLF